MNKVIGIPHSSIASDIHLSIFDKIINELRLQFWSFRLKKMKYENLLIDSKNVVENIISAHSLLNAYILNLNFEATIESNNGWKIEISKAFYAKEESIILILFKAQAVGQSSFSICFENENGVIKGIKNMFHGLLFQRYFYDLESPFLDPTVLAALKTAEKGLKKGKVTSVRFSNKPQEFGYSNLEKNNLKVKPPEMRPINSIGLDLK